MKKLEVSQQEMLYMRDEGMTNKEIAEHLDISYATVLRYIGAEPKKKREGRPRRSPVEKVEVGMPVVCLDASDTEPVRPVAERMAERMEPVEKPVVPNFNGLTVISNVVTIKGVACTFDVDLTEKIVTMRSGDVEGMMDAETCRVFCRELMKIYSAMEAN